MKQKEKVVRLCATITGQLVHHPKAVFSEHRPPWTESQVALLPHGVCTMCILGRWQLPATGKSMLRDTNPSTVRTQQVQSTLNTDAVGKPKGPVGSKLQDSPFSQEDKASPSPPFPFLCPMSAHKHAE